MKFRFSNITRMAAFGFALGGLVPISVAQESCTVQLDVAAAAAKIQDRLAADGNVVDLGPLVEANFGIAVPLMDQGFVVDGIFSPGEYSQANACAISFGDDTNPGRPQPGQNELITEEGGDDDLSLRLYMGHTADTLYLAYQVTDDFLDLGGRDAGSDDGVEIFINSDLVDNGRTWSRGGFHLTTSPSASRNESDYISAGKVRPDSELDASWNNRISGGGVVAGSGPENLKANEFWSQGLPIPGTSDYLIEWQIPLTAMDTDPSAGATVAPTIGDVMLFNTVVNDNDRQNAGGQDTHAMLWVVESDDRGPWQGAEKTWPIPIELTDKADFGDVGDLNDDGVCDAIDIDLLSAAIRNGEIALKFDLDQNGSVDRNDFVNMIKSVKRTWFGDSNMDGEFSTRDLVTVSNRDSTKLALMLAGLLATGTVTAFSARPIW